MPTTAFSDLSPSSPLTAAMRDRRMDKIAAFPFSVGCVSESSVAIGQSRTRRPQLEPPIPQGGGGGGGRQSTSKTVSLGLQKLLKSLKGFSQFFALDRKEEQEEEEEEEEEVEMEIGFPTDVQHVAHIGWNGFGNAGGIKSWGTAPECLSLHSVSHKPFELAVAAARPGPLIRV